MPRETLRANDVRVETFFDVAAYRRDGGFRDDATVYFYNHHEAHALPPLFYTDWSEALLVTADGGGDTVITATAISATASSKRSTAATTACSFPIRSTAWASPMRRRRRRSAFARIATKASSQGSPRWASRSSPIARQPLPRRRRRARALRFRQQPGHVRVHASTSPRTASARTSPLRFRKSWKTPWSRRSAASWNGTRRAISALPAACLPMCGSTGCWPNISISMRCSSSR